MKTISSITTELFIRYVLINYPLYILLNLLFSYVLFLCGDEEVFALDISYLYEIPIVLTLANGIFTWKNTSSRFQFLVSEKTTSPNQSFRTVVPKKIAFDQLLAKIKQSGFGISMINEEKNAIKIYEKYKLFNWGCGALITINNKSKIEVQSFSLRHTKPNVAGGSLATNTMDKFMKHLQECIA